MTPQKARADDKAIEALIGASMRTPGKETEVTDEEISRHVEQRVTLSAEDRAALDKSKPGLKQAIKEILRGKEQVGREHVKGRHTRGIYFRRAAFDAYIIHALPNDDNLGRTKIEKITHLAEYHCGVDCEREPVRDAAGPVDYGSRRKVESLAKKQGWYSAVAAQNRWGVRYVPGPKLAAALPIAERMLRSRKPAVDALIALMRPLNTKCCEIVATLYAAWNDLLLRGESPTDEEILHEARESWHPNKLTIAKQRWIGALGWMRDNHLIPKGRGKPVPPAA